MSTGGTGAQQDECALIWSLARTHGWSTEVQVDDLVKNANVTDEQQARQIARNQLRQRPFINYHQGRDTIWISAPPGDDICYFLRDHCGYSELQIEATFSSYFDGF